MGEGQAMSRPQSESQHDGEMVLIFIAFIMVVIFFGSCL
jgi:hypothetical protein